MTQTIRAHYEHGVFTPLDPVDVAEGADVTLTVVTPHPSTSDSPFDRCFGGWQEFVDTETLLRDIRQHRKLITVRETQS